MIPLETPPLPEPVIVQEAAPMPLWVPSFGSGDPLKAIESANAGAVITPADFRGAIVYFPYVPGAVYRVDSAVNRPTTLTFGRDEELLMVSRTEEKEWTVEPVREVLPHRILLSPVDPKAHTRLVAVTSLGSYVLDLRANQRTSLVEVQWRHPPKPTPVKPASVVYGVGYVVSDLQVPWRPIYAWDDGQATSLLFGEDYHAGEAPAVAVLTMTGERQLVNYRPYDRVLLVDRKLAWGESFELRLGVGNDGQVIQVSQGQSYRKIRCPGDGVCGTIAAHTEARHVER